MDLKNLVDVSPFLLFEASGDSEQVEELCDLHTIMDHDVIDQADDDYDSDDAESCSYEVSDHSCSCSYCDCIGEDLHECDEKGEEEVEEGDREAYWPCEHVEEKPATLYADSGEQVVMMDEMEKSRLFWETCLAS